MLGAGGIFATTPMSRHGPWKPCAASRRTPRLAATDRSARRAARRTERGYCTIRSGRRVWMICLIPCHRLRDFPLLSSGTSTAANGPARRGRFLARQGLPDPLRQPGVRAPPCFRAKLSAPFGHSAQERVRSVRPAMRVSRKPAPGSAAISASTTAAAGLLHRVTDPPIRPNSIRRRPKRWRRNRGGEPFGKRPQPVQINRSTSQGRRQVRLRSLSQSACSRSARFSARTRSRAPAAGRRGRSPREYHPRNRRRARRPPDSSRCLRA